VVAKLKIIEKLKQKIIRKTGRYYSWCGHPSFDNFYNQFSCNFERSDPLKQGRCIEEFLLKKKK
jgi:hypothetical protein